MKLPKPVKREKRRKRVRRVKRTRPGVPSVAKLDRLAGALCRSEGVCAAVGYVPPQEPDEEPVEVKCNGSLSWAHIISRSYRRIRYWRSNCMPLCMGHHVYFTFRPLHWEKFVTEKIGSGAYERLRRAAFNAPKLDRQLVFDSLSEGRWPTEVETCQPR